MTGNRVLITGGAGFIGSHIADELIKNDFKVSIIDNLSTGKLENINPNATFYKMDILKDDLSSIFELQMPQIVIHLAAQISVAQSVQDAVFDANENIIGTLKILDYCKKYNTDKIIASSSAAVYGDLISPLKEDMKLSPLSNYGISKLTMEKYIEISGMDYLICRFSNVYGERQAADGEAGVVTIFENAMKNNENITIFGDGNQIRDFIYVKDVAKIVHNLIEQNVRNKTLNISTNIGTTINDLFKSLSEQYHYTKAPIYKDKRIGDIDISILDNFELMQLFDFKFKSITKNLFAKV